jgi:histidinol-phosphate aminotransferase
MPELALAELLRPELTELGPYLPVQGQFEVRLDANEAPNLLSEPARHRLAEVAAQTAWERYPDATAAKLRRAIADRSGVSQNEVLVGAGSDEIIALLLTVLCRPRAKASTPTLVTTTPTFVMYRMSARVRGMRVLEVPLDDQWDLAPDGIRRAIELGSPNLIFIASPNNPTSTLMSLDRIEQIIDASQGALVIVDEAYINYASQDHLALYRKHPNLALLRTLSKIGFAALRVGWIIARPALITELDKARLPYNMPTLSQNLGTVVLTELQGEIVRICSTVVSERERLAAELSALKGVEVTPSQANFLWFRTDRSAAEVFQSLVDRGILVRSFHERGGRLGHQLRVTVGTETENRRFLQAIREVL